MPKMERCWGFRLPPNIALEITEDLEEVASFDANRSHSLDATERVAAAAYELSFCYIEGYGCDVSYERAAQLLIQSADLGSRRAQNDLLRMFAALNIQIPTSIEGRLHEWTAANAISGSPSALEELRDLDAALFASTKQKMRTTYSPLGIDFFGDDIRSLYNLHDISSFIGQITHANESIPFDTEDGGGLTWLHYAATNGSTDVVRLLAQQPNCDIDRCTVTNWTPLWMACAAGHSEVVEVLLNEKASAKIASEKGRTCLHYLQAFEPDVVGRIANRLLDAGADIEAKDDSDETPLFSACLMRQGTGAVPAVDVLIQRGASPAAISSSGYSCIDQAATNLDPALLRALLQSAVFSDERGAMVSVDVRATAIQSLCKIPKSYRFRHGGALRQTKTMEVLELLVSDDVVATYIANSAKAHNPLHDACIWGCSDLIEQLCSFGSIKINQFAAKGGKDATTLLPLFEALKLNHTQIVQTLVNHGADITLSDSDNRNVLHFVVEYAPGLLDFFLTRLRQRGRDIQAFINAGARRGLTPLDEAVRAERFDLADILLHHGAQYTEFTRLGEAGERYTSLSMTGCSRQQMSYFLDMPADRRPDLVVCSNGFTLFHLTAANLINGKSSGRRKAV